MIKCKFDRTVGYGKQLFIKGQTYDLSEKDAAALGFPVPKKPAKKAIKATKNDK